MLFSNGYTSQSVEHANAMRRLCVQERREEKLDSVRGTPEEQGQFVQELKFYYETKGENAYHYFIYEEYNECFRHACKALGVPVSKFNCRCSTEGGRSHRHYIVWLSNPKSLKNPTQVVTRKVRGMMAAQGVARNPQDRHVLYGKKIQSAVHLLNAILYIQTEKARGRHGGSLQNCMHTHQKHPVVFPNKDVCRVFKEEFVDVEIPEYKMKRVQDWLKYKSGKTEKKEIEKFENHNFDDDFDC